MFINLESVPHFYKNYVKQVDTTDVLTALRLSGYRTLELVHSIPEKLSDHRYAPGKWSIRELLVHLADAERVFAYRALRFARNDQTVLSSFDENSYTPESNASGRSMKKIADELQHLRVSTNDLFESFTAEMLARKGLVGSNELTVAALGFIIAGHETHHRQILKERYLV
jgi:uncharacterized damage-inducible protein DinB